MIGHKADIGTLRVHLEHGRYGILIFTISTIETAHRDLHRCVFYDRTPSGKQHKLFDSCVIAAIKANMADRLTPINHCGKPQVHNLSRLDRSACTRLSEPDRRPRARRVINWSAYPAAHHGARRLRKSMVLSSTSSRSAP